MILEELTRCCKSPNQGIILFITYLFDYKLNGSPTKRDSISFDITTEYTGTTTASNIQAKIWIGRLDYTWSGPICDFSSWDSSLSAGGSKTHSLTFSRTFDYDDGYYA